MLLAIPLTGWLLSSSGGRVTSFWGLFGIPPLPISKESGDLFEDMHELLAKLTIGLVILHVAGALKHHLEGHRHFIRRMALRRRRGS